MRWAGYAANEQAYDFSIFVSTRRPTIALCKSAEASGCFDSDPFDPHNWGFMWRAANRCSDYYASLPQQCLGMYEIMAQKLTHRRKDTLRNILFVAEALCHRGAYERTSRVLFAQDSLIMWVKLAKKHSIRPQAVKTALDYLHETEFIDYKNGIKGDRLSCTRVDLKLSHLDLADMQDTYDWQSELDWVMGEVLEREELCREERVLQLRQADSLLLDTMGQFTLDFGHQKS